MDLSPEKRFGNRKSSTVEKKFKESLKEKLEAATSVESNVREEFGKQNLPKGLFSGGRVSNLSSTVTKEDQDAARRRGDLLQLLSCQSPPSIETLFSSLKKDQ